MIPFTLHIEYVSTAVCGTRTDHHLPAEPCEILTLDLRVRVAVLEHFLSGKDALLQADSCSMGAYNNKHFEVWSSSLWESAEKLRYEPQRNLQHVKGPACP